MSDRADDSRVVAAELPEPQVLIPMGLYRAYVEFYESLSNIERAIDGGRLEGKLEGYRLVLSHTQSPMSPIRNPAAVAALERLIAVCEQDLKRLEPPEPETPEKHYCITERGRHHIDVGCSLPVGHEGSCQSIGASGG
jgi:hypothetical protein